MATKFLIKFLRKGVKYFTTLFISAKKNKTG